MPKVYLNNAELADAEVCIHLKGFARATVTHLDIEHPLLSGLIPPEVRTFSWIIGIEGGILIRTEQNDTVKVVCPLLNQVLPQGEKTKTCVGGKPTGLFIGFRRRELSKLKELAAQLLLEPTT
ncbi:MAG TPA: hypothetical protein VMW67_02310 [Desulfobacteria bacterium]|nr:hypothetical protein [Desulfobacteria bacterium]